MAQGIEPAVLALTVTSITREAEDVSELSLAGLDVAELPPFDPGSHIQLHLPGGMSRSYTLVGSASDRHKYTIAVQRQEAGRGGSRWLHDSLRLGDAVRARAPLNNFPLVENASLSVFIAGGIGITPFVSMIHRLNCLRRRWRLYYSARSRPHAAYLDLLRELLVPGGEIVLRFSDEKTPRFDLASIIQAAPTGTHFYCCGPSPMLGEFNIASQDLPSECIHVESFGGLRQEGGGSSFVVELAKSNLSLEVPPERTILECVLDAGVDAAYSCMSGFCGACETSVLEGHCDHRDDYLSETEKRAGDRIMICVSRASSEQLTLDL